MIHDLKTLIGCPDWKGRNRYLFIGFWYSRVLNFFVLMNSIPLYISMSMKVMLVSLIWYSKLMPVSTVVCNRCMKISACMRFSMIAATSSTIRLYITGL